MTTTQVPTDVPALQQENERLRRAVEELSILNDLAPELKSSTPGRLAAMALPHLRTVIRLGAEGETDRWPLPGSARAMIQSMPAA